MCFRALQDPMDHEETEYLCTLFWLSFVCVCVWIPFKVFVNIPPLSLRVREERRASKVPVGTGGLKEME